MATSSDAFTDIPADVMEQSILEKCPERSGIESKIAKTLLSQIDATVAPLYAELLNEKASCSSLKRSVPSSGSSSGPMQPLQKKTLRAHVSISSDETPCETRCEFICLACAYAGVPPILDCCLKRGHSDAHVCILCLDSRQQVETSSAFRLPVVNDTQSTA